MFLLKILPHCQLNKLRSTSKSGIPTLPNSDSHHKVSSMMVTIPNTFQLMVQRQEMFQQHLKTLVQSNFLDILALKKILPPRNLEGMDQKSLGLDSQHRINSLSPLEDMTNLSLFGKSRDQELFRKNLKPIQLKTHLLKKTSQTRVKLRKRNNNLPVKLLNKLRILIKTKIWKH